MLKLWRIYRVWCNKRRADYIANKVSNEICKKIAVLNSMNVEMLRRMNATLERCILTEDKLKRSLDKIMKD
jgi:predicted nucleic acid-binding protein